MLWALILTVVGYNGYRIPIHMGEYATYEDCAAVYRAALKRNSDIKDGTCVKVVGILWGLANLIRMPFRRSY